MNAKYYLYKPLPTAYDQSSKVHVCMYFTATKRREFSLGLAEAEDTFSENWPVTVYN
jgi:hypothetical protein